MENINNSSTKENLSNSVIWNAISAYLMIFVSWLFLFNTSNKNINSDFVKWHTKSATMIHLWFFITYIVFINFWLFSSISILWIRLNNIITDVIFLWLISLLIIWIYRARKALSFNLSSDISITKYKNGEQKNISILDIDWNWETTEKEKLSILLSYVPFIWFINYWKYRENKNIQEATRLNVTISLIIILLYYFNHWNLANLLSLLYIILIVFIGINIFVKNELLQIILPKFFSPEKIHFLIIVSMKYLKNYFNDNKFKDFKTLLDEENQINIQNEQKFLDLLNTKNDLKQAKFLVYIPFINIIFLFIRNTKYSFHIINGIMITFTTSVIMILSYFTNINNYIYYIILFPILFWIWIINYKLDYKMPFMFDLYIFLSKILSILKFWTKKLNEKRKEVNDITLKVNK